MIEGSFGGFGRFRLWQNEAHPAFCKRVKNGGFLRACAREVEYFEENNIILEVMIPRGGRTLYGLLGFRSQAPGEELISMDSGEGELLSVECYKESLIGSFEVVKIGLLSGYLESSMRGVVCGVSNESFVSLNDFEICYAAYGDVSSSESFFEKIGFALSCLYKKGEAGLSEDDVGSFLAGFFYGRN